MAWSVVKISDQSFSAHLKIIKFDKKFTRLHKLVPDPSQYYCKVDNQLRNRNMDLKKVKKLHSKIYRRRRILAKNKN